MVDQGFPGVWFILSDYRRAVADWENSPSKITNDETICRRNYDAHVVVTSHLVTNLGLKSYVPLLQFVITCIAPTTEKNKGGKNAMNTRKNNTI